MKIIKFKKAAMEILDFEKQYNLELTVYEKDPEAKDLPRYYTRFDSAETKVGKCCLLGESGDGNTPEEAIKDYCKKISNKILVIDAMSDTNRREIEVPELQHTLLTLQELFPTEESLQGEIERVKKMMEPMEPLPTDPEKLREALRLIGEREAAFQQELQKQRTMGHFEAKEELNPRILVIPVGDNLLSERIRQILIRYAGQVKNEFPSINKYGI